ncbi:MAG TPA: gliding motility-associated C-terminal domain-containing protein [Chitinophagaceae bacterium]|nr:gliding motility-associated C-terminal domain-containing protein [Chitinophagaceae bacterium]
MKIRNGFVSNSSSSSFIVLFPKEPKNATDVKNMLFKEDKVAREEVKVTVVCNGGNIFVPNTFSPNGDGMNDVFYPRGKGVYTIKSFRIFNRWGEMVFEKTNFQANDASAGWDGMYKGVKQPTDAYVYSIEIMCDNSISVPAKGSITILR